jgi:hypothetical protein
MSQHALVTVETNGEGELSGSQSFVVASGQELVPNEGLVITKITVEFPIEKRQTESNRTSDSQTD